MNWRESNSQRPYIVNELETVKNYGEPGEQVQTCLVLKAFVLITLRRSSLYVQVCICLHLFPGEMSDCSARDNRERRRSNPPTKKSKTFVCKPLKSSAMFGNHVTTASELAKAAKGCS